MQRNHVLTAAVAAAGAVLLGVVVAFQAPLTSAATGVGPAQQTLALPTIPAATAPVGPADLQECLQTGECAPAATAALGSTQIDLIQDNRVATLPAVHVVTRTVDAPPAVWSLADEHGGTLLSLSCGEHNCIIELGVTAELTVVLDLRLRDGVAQGRIEGAAMTPSAAVHAVDFDRDGVLEVALLERSFAGDGNQMSTYYRTLSNDDGMLTTSGCTVPTATPATPPRSMLTGDCPTS